MFCNKGRIKNSSFFLFLSPKMGKTNRLLPEKIVLAMLSAVRCLLRKMSGRFFIFCTKSKKLCTKNIRNPAGFQKPFVVYAENVEETPPKFSILSRKTYLCKINRTNRL